MAFTGIYRLSLAVVAAAGLGGVPAAAQTVEATPFKVEGLVVGKKWVIDAAFAAEHNVAVPLPFGLIVPTGDDHLNLSQAAPGGTGTVKFHFATLDKQPMENMQFVPMTSPAGADMDTRLQSLAKALVEQAFPAAAGGAQASKVDVVRKIEVGPYAAVDVFGRYQTEADGLVFLRLVGIPHPDRPEGVFVVMNLIASRVPLQKIEDLDGTRTGRALSTFRFQ